MLAYACGKLALRASRATLAAIGLLVQTLSTKFMRTSNLYRQVFIWHVLVLTSLAALRQQAMSQENDEHFTIDSGQALPVLFKGSCIFDTTKSLPPDQDTWVEFLKENSADKYFRNFAIAIHRVLPWHPPDFPSQHGYRKVLVKLYIDSLGDVSSACIIKSDESAESNKAILRAAVQWKFTPAEAINGIPVGKWETIPFAGKSTK